MAAQLSPRDMLMVEVQKLEEQKTSLLGQIKAHNVTINNLREQVTLERIASQQAVAEVRDQCQARCEELKQTIGPYEDMKHAHDSLKQQIEQLRREKVEAVTAIKLSKGQAISEANAVLESANSRLAKIEQAIAACQQKVATL